MIAVRKEQALTPETDMGGSVGRRTGRRDTSLDAATVKKVYDMLKREWFTLSLRCRGRRDRRRECLALDGSATHHRENWEDLTPGVAFTSFDRVSEG
jgi:hypothetical protein